MVANYLTTVYHKLKCLGGFSIRNKSTVEFVNPMYRGNLKANVSDKDIRKRIISIPLILHIMN